MKEKTNVLMISVDQLGRSHTPLGGDPVSMMPTLRHLAEHGIGLININQRIRLLFGQEYGVFLSNENDFAIAAMLIPINSEGGSSC